VERPPAENSDTAQSAAEEVAVKSQLLADLGRWETELARHGLTRPTLWAGVYAKAFRSSRSWLHVLQPTGRPPLDYQGKSFTFQRRAPPVLFSRGGLQCGSSQSS
jgi:hypothetical protein